MRAPLSSSLLLLALGLGFAACGDEKADNTDTSDDGDGGTGTDGTDGTDDADGTDGTDGTDDGTDGGDDGTEAVDADGDGAASDVDCDDADPAVHPGAEELVDGIDNDCDPETTEAGRATWVDAAGTTDVTAALQGSWTAPADGVLHLGGGATFAAELTVPAGLSVELVGHSIDGSLPTIEDGVPLSVAGSAVARDLVLVGMVEADVDGALSLSDVDIDGELALLPGAEATLSGGTVTGSNGIVGYAVPGEPERPRHLTATGTTVSTSFTGIARIEDVQLTEVVITGASEGVSGFTTLLATQSELGGDLALTVATPAGGPASATLDQTRVEGRTAVSVASGSTLWTEGSDIHGSQVGILATDASLTLSGGTLSAESSGSTVRLDTSSGATTAAFTGVVFAGGPVSSQVEYHLVAMGDSTVTLDSCELRDATGGAVLLLSRGAGTSEITHTLFENNQNLSGGTPANNGGAVHVDSDSHTVQISSSQFIGNSATGSGGALSVDGTVHSSGNTFDQNSSGVVGGGVTVVSGATFSSTGDTFTDNTATLYGGGINHGGALTLDAVTLHRNSASSGGAVAAAMLTLSTSWDTGSGADANTPNDFYWRAGSTAADIDSGTGTVVCGNGSALCVTSRSP